jgi:hypothetical protein
MITFKEYLDLTPKIIGDFENRKDADAIFIQPVIHHVPDFTRYSNPTRGFNSCKPLASGEGGIALTMNIRLIKWEDFEEGNVLLLPDIDEYFDFQTKLDMRLRFVGDEFLVPFHFNRNHNSYNGWQDASFGVHIVYSDLFGFKSFFSHQLTSAHLFSEFSTLTFGADIHLKIGADVSAKVDTYCTDYSVVLPYGMKRQLAEQAASQGFVRTLEQE